MKRVQIVKREDTLDLVWGVPAIARYLGLKVPQVYHLIYKKRIPVTKLSRQIVCARKSDLAALFGARKA